MARETAAQLRARIEELEAENAALKVEEPTAEKGAKRRGWGWTLLATVFIVIGALLAPVAVIGSWVAVSLTDTDHFVAAYAPLASDPQVQAFVTSEVVEIVNDQVDVAQLTSDVIDGIIELGTGPVASTALETLKGPASQGILSLIESTVNGFVTSDAFATVWAESLRISHSQVVSAMTNDPDSALQISQTGEVGIQLGPIIAQVKTVLIDKGLGFAEQIPAIDRTIVIAQSDSLPTIQFFYNLTVSLGTWLPLIAIAFLALGVAVARRRALALIWASVSLAVVMAVTIVALNIGGLVFVASLTPVVMPAGLANVLFGSVTTDMFRTSIAVLVVAIVLAIVAWLAGPFSVPRKLRALAQSGATSVREAAEKRGLSTGRVGEWLYRQRTLLRVVIAVAAGAAIFLIKPLTVSLILWTLFLSVIAIIILELVQRPVVSIPDEAELVASE